MYVDPVWRPHNARSGSAPPVLALRTIYTSESSGSAVRERRSEHESIETSQNDTALIQFLEMRVNDIELGLCSDVRTEN